MSKPSHECSACGGSALTWYRVAGTQTGRALWLTLPGGYRECYLGTDRPDNATRWLDRAEAKRRATIENRSGLWRGIEWTAEVVSCPVCLGSGRVSDVMPVRDALADAETLRISIVEMHRESGYFSTLGLGIDVSRTRDSLYQALAYGAKADRHAFFGRKNMAASDSETAARAAFRAVPALRGE